MIFKKNLLLLTLFLIIIFQTFLYLNNNQKTSFRYFKWTVQEVSIGKLISISFFSGLFISTLLNTSFTSFKKNNLENIEENYETLNSNEDIKSNMINIKKVRKAEKLLGNIYSGFILSVQTYGFFVEISELNVEGLVHVSTLNNDWYEYRSRQNLLIGRKSKKSYKVGDAIEVKIIKVDILKYQIDLELT